VPTVSSVSPNTGDALGGTAVTITGTNFATGATADFGGTLATNVVVSSSTTITANTPAGAAGAVTVTVTNPSSLSGALASAFTYTTGGTQPTVSNVAPSTGPWAGGTTMTITGSNFVTGASVAVGGVAATGVTFVNSTELTCASPAAAPGTTGVQPVSVTNPGGAGATNTSPGFTYTSLAVEALSDTATDADIAIDGAGTIHVVWQRTTSVPATDIMYARSTDGGQSWSTPTGLDLTSNAVSRPRIAASGNNVIVVWNEVSTTQDVRRVESTNNGAAWSSVSTVASGSIRPDPDVAVLGSGVYVVAYLVNGGVGPQSSTYQHVYTVRGAFSGPFASPVAAQTGGIICSYPALATAGTNNLYITYHQTTTFGPTVAGSGNIDLSLVRSTDGGVSYATPQVIANDGNDHLYPAVVATGTTVVVTRLVSSAVMLPQVGLTWSWRVETLRSTDSGVTFSAGATLANGNGSSSSRLGAALDGSGGITVCWRAANDIYSARSTDGGATFAAGVNLSSNAGVSQRPQVAGGSGSQVVHVWTDDSASTGTFDVLTR
jgi:hypothetical protein